MVTAATTRPPESDIDLPQHSGLAGDIWSTACAAYNVLASGPHFRLDPACRLEDESDEILKQISQILGPPPDDRLVAWNPNGHFCIAETQMEEAEGSTEQIPLRQKLASMGRLLGRVEYDCSMEENDDLHDLLERMLKWRPCERISADQACQSKWMQKWGLPAIERTGG